MYESPWFKPTKGVNVLSFSLVEHYSWSFFLPRNIQVHFLEECPWGYQEISGAAWKMLGHMKCIKNVNIPSGFTLLQALLIHRTRALEQTLTVLTVQRINKIRDTVKFYKSLKTFCHKDTYHICLDFLKHDSS